MPTTPLAQDGVPVCLKIIKNNKDFFDQSLDEIKLLQHLKDCGDPDKYHFLCMYDYFYYKVCPKAMAVVVISTEVINNV